jgi:hypothetical protein
VLDGWSLGLAWFTVLAGAYTYQRVRDDVHPKALAVVFGSWSIAELLQTDLAGYSPARHETTFTLSHWTDGGWRALPGHRIELSGDEEEYLPFQWAANSSATAHTLDSAGWQPAPVWSARSTLLWLSPQTSLAALPVVQKRSEGNSAELVYVKFDPRRPMTRLVLRLWRSRSRLAINGMPGTGPGIPIWYGVLYQEAFQQPWHFVTLGASATWPDASAIPQLLPTGIRMLSRTASEDGAVRRAVLILPGASEAPQ